MHLGLSFNMAGTLINNLAFLGALVMLYLWVAERHGRTAARWSTAVLAWCPFSLFSTVIYTEGLFLLGSIAALRAFDRQQYLWAMLWSALTTALRPPGVALVLTFLWVAWRERRGAIAYLTALVSSAGLLLYMLYCGLQFHQPLAFALAQRGLAISLSVLGWGLAESREYGSLGSSKQAQGQSCRSGLSSGNAADNRPEYPAMAIAL